MEEQPPTCKCQEQQSNKQLLSINIRKTTKTIPSIITSVLIAFFPKCPLCWAVYMSMFSSVGLAHLHYMPWLLPVLFLFLAIHLILILKKVPQKGYLPFALSLTGAVVVLSGRIFFPFQDWLLESGMVLVISGSLLNSFTSKRLTENNLKTTH